MFQRGHELAEFRRRVLPSETVDSVLCATESAPAARNLGAVKATTSVLAFLDDDCRPEQSLWLSRLVEPITDLTAELTTGAVTGWHARSRTPLGRTANYVIPVLVHPVGNPEAMVATSAATVWGGNFAVKTSVFRAIGGFARYPPGPCLYEETELSIRAKRSGARIRYVPDASVRHSQAQVGGMRDVGVLTADRFVGRQKALLIAAVYGNSPVAAASRVLNVLVFGGKRAIRRDIRGAIEFCHGIYA